MQFKFRNTKIIISFSFFALILLLVVFEKVEYLFVSIFSAILHETGHLFALKKFGAEIIEFKISLFGGNIKTNNLNNINYFNEIVAVFSGPFVNLLLASFLLFLNFIFDNVLITKIIVVNLILGIFNLLPFYSFDGGKILKLLIENKFGEKTADLTVAIISVIILIPFSYISFLNFLNNKNDFYLIIVSILMLLTIILKK